MNTKTLVQTDNIAQFKNGVDTLLQKRDYFIQKILPKLVEGRDYYTIKGRKSLGKAGAEKLATIYSLVATFAKDTETIESLRGVEGLVAFVCTLTHSGEVVGQGRGAAILKSHNGDANKTIKMALKSSYIDSVIRSTGLSDIFTSDLETMTPESISQSAPEIQEAVEGRRNFSEDQAVQEDMITPRQKAFLTQLIFENIGNEEQREEWLQKTEECSKADASELISSFLMSAQR